MLSLPLSPVYTGLLYFCEYHIIMDDACWQQKPEKADNSISGQTTITRYLKSAFFVWIFKIQAKEIPGIKIFRSSATICFTNADMYLEVLQEKVCITVSMSARCNPPAVYSTFNCCRYRFLLSHLVFSFLTVMLGLFWAEWSWHREAADGKEETRCKAEA